MDGLSEAQRAVYDRQLRVWGAETQKRLSESKVAIVGCTGVATEVAKNLALAGVGSVVLVDDMPCGRRDPGNLLVAEDVDTELGVAAACAHALQEMNPLVQVEALASGLDGLLSWDGLRGCQAILTSGIPLGDVARVDARCAELGVAYFHAECRGWLGWAFADLGNHEWADERPGKDGGAKVLSRGTTSYCRWDAALSDPLKGRNLRRVHPGYLVLRAEAARERGTTIEEAVAGVREQLGLATGSPDLNTSRAYVDSPHGMPALNAIVGGIVANNVLSAVSRRGTVFDNFFLFSIADGAGIVQRFG